MVGFRKIALFCNQDNVQILQLLGLKRGFEQLGVECFAVWPLLTAPQMELFLDVWKPDVVLELDRSRAQVGTDLGAVRHVAWIQNARNFGVSVLEGGLSSDLTYFCILPERAGLTVDPAACRWLFPGADESLFFPDDDEPRRYDLSLCGFLHSQIKPEFFDTPVDINGARVGTVRDFLDEIIGAGLYDEYGYDLRAIHELILFKMRRVVPDTKMSDIPESFIELFETRFHRLLRRKMIADGMLLASSNIAFCGRNSWLTWPQYAPHYLGDKTRPSELARIYRQTRLNVHESTVSLHHRTMEVLACGRALLVGRSFYVGTPLDIARYFTPGEDFLWYAPSNFADAAREALADPVRLEQIGRNVHRKVQAGHLWRHRAEQILDDLGQL